MKLQDKKSNLHKLSLVDWATRWYKRRVLICKLQNLNDHYLKDIGLDRSEINSYADRAFSVGEQSKNFENSTSLLTIGCQQCVSILKPHLLLRTRR